jgi:predicted RNA-binding Zn ribbon-like protein
VDFGSHIGGTVLTAVELVNGLTAGESSGRPYPAPPVEQAADLLERTLHGRQTAAHGRPSEEETRQFMVIATELRAVFTAVADGDHDRAAGTLNRLMSSWHALPTLSRHDNEPWHLHFHRPGAPFTEGWAAGLATGLAFVVGSEHADRLGLCSASACDRVYADTSRNGTRRFCSITCQNRVKAAAFRARRAALP